MDRKSAFEVIRQAIEAAPVNPKDADGVKFKGLAVAALVIAEESLNDFAKLAEAVKELAAQPRTINLHVGSDGKAEMNGGLPLFINNRR